MTMDENVKKPVLTMWDFVTVEDIAIKDDQDVRSRRGDNRNVEYGERKYIKPWRTGTKSQQLPPRGNFKKNSGKGGK